MITERERRVLTTAADISGDDDLLAASTILAKPRALEVLGREIARRLEGASVSAIASWASRESAVLNHVVARQINAATVAAFTDQGRVTVDPPTTVGETVAIVDIDHQSYPGLQSLVRSLASSGYRVVVIATVLRDSQADNITDIAVHELERQSNTSGTQQ